MRKRKVIAMLMGNAGLRSDYQGMLRGGAERAAIQADVDLWVFAGRSDWRECGPAQAFVHRLVSAQRVDGIIIAAGCIATFADVEELAEALKQDCGVPMCAIGQRLEGVSSIVIDNTGGAAEVARHLALTHHCRRFGYIAGPEGHEESEHRLRATVTALADLGIALPEGAVRHGNFSSPSGEAEARILLDGPYALDALIAGNDDMAAGARAALAHRGLRCPEDIRVAGFDDSPSARFCNPALTTARQPVARLGAEAVARLLSMWRGESVPLLSSLPTESVIRESCGCDPLQVRSTLAVPEQEQLRDHLAQFLSGVLEDESSRLVWATRLCASFEAECAGTSGALARVFDALIEPMMATDVPLHDLQRVVSCLRGVAARTAVSQTLEGSLHDLRAKVGSAMQQRENAKRVRDEQQLEDLRLSSERIATSLSLTALRKALALELIRLGIVNGWVAVFESPATARLVPLALVKDGQAVPVEQVAFPAKLLFPGAELDVSKRCSWTVLPLTFEWEVLGIAMLDLPPSHEVYAALREQISSAIQTARLHEQTLYQERTNALVEEERRVTAERLRLVSLIAGGVAHDLNNALGPIVALPETIRRDLSVLEVRQEILGDLDAVHKSGIRAANIIRDLSTLGQTAAAPKHAFDLAQLVADERSSIKALCEARANVALEVEASAPQLIVRASKSCVLRAFSNVVANAAEAIVGSGKITLSVQRRVLPEALEAFERIEPGCYAVISVKDSGVGIPPENLSKVLEPFFTSKPRTEQSGAGLGLSIVHRIVKDALGYLDVESRLGEGTTFSMYFPIEEGALVRPSSIPERPRGGTERILVVDDEPVQLRTAKRVLSHFGYSVTTAQSGNEALELYFAAQPGFDLVVLDLLMNGMNGLELLRRIRLHNPPQRAIVATGHGRSLLDPNLEENRVAWLAKPYSMNTLGAAVREALDGRPSTVPLRLAAAEVEMVARQH